MSTMKVASLVFAAVLTAVLGFAEMAAFVTQRDVLVVTVKPLLMTTAAVGWVSFIAAHCRDSLINAVAERLQQVESAVADACELRASDAALAALRAATAGRQAAPAARLHVVDAER